MFFFPETRHGGANNMGATYNNTQQSKWLLNNHSVTCLKWPVCAGSDVFLLHVWNIWHEIHMKFKSIWTADLFIFGASAFFWPVISRCTDSQVKVEFRGIDKEAVSLMFPTVIVKGLEGVEHRPCFRPLSFTAPTPAGIHGDTPCWLFTIPPHGMCSFFLYLFTGSPIHAHTLPAYFLALFFFIHVTLSCTCCHFLSV